MSRLNKALKKILATGETLTFDHIYNAIPDEHKAQLDRALLGQTLEHYLLQSGNTNQAVNRHAETVVSRESLFAECSFRVRLTPYELEDRQLIIGHRFLPYIHPGIPIEELRFFDENDRPLEVERQEMQVNQSTSIFFNLLPPYGISQYIEGDGTSQNLHMAFIDLDDWLKAQQFAEDDQLLISARDYANLEFYIEKLDSREIASQKLADRYYNKQLTEAIYHVFSLIGKSFLPVDMHLLWAFGQLEPGLIENGGTPFGPFISQHETLTFFQDGPYAFLQDKNFMDELMETAIEQAKNSNTEKMGTATGLNAIFQELGNSFSKLLLKACIVEHLLEWDDINRDDLYEQVFGGNTNPFYNARQKENFEKAFDRLVESVREKWKDRKLALPHLQLLRKAIQFKMEIVYLLRELNKINDPNQLNMQALLQLQPIDQSLDQILENLLSKKPMPYQEAQTLVKQLETGREKFLLFRDDLLEGF
ncbi:hypothetical protein [Flavilitoribacter nigricans]|uniref:Uncharacterized protein n=1 Tax=Flavilitoribacter nigricans (strain ATCC 23147 / DSM 23189 / NBRC 102662 / NCIMB 1420 / SS-2) TaxID=1122177 RepID=A0A2D0N783_FLAN2|nr:hypothetical protein [Flavilitoribacter nigricans]PHN04246.1 hypothetical protein CRP01_22045 [Flavilitoribacter nigricans DSM 23189 = NBRC 102662]